MIRHESRARELLIEFFREHPHGTRTAFRSFRARHPACAGELTELHEEVLRLRSDLLLSPLSIVRSLGGDPGEGARPSRIGSFEVLGELGRGGMGIVWKAYDAELDRVVALKVPRLPSGKEEEVRRRFVTEARIASRLQHRGVPTVYGLGRDRQGTPFLAMQWVEGITLRTFLRGRESARWTRTFRANFGRVCETLGHAHRHGIVHCDVKPTNVLVDGRGHVHVIDWGLARVVGETGCEASLAGVSRSAVVEGTPAYMAPEQARGQGEAIDPRTDVFALGAILFEFLLGHPPTMACSASELEQAHLDLEACGGEVDLVELARACLSFELFDRPLDADAVGRALRAGGRARARA